MKLVIFVDLDATLATVICSVRVVGQVSFMILKQANVPVQLTSTNKLQISPANHVVIDVQHVGVHPNTNVPHVTIIKIES